MPIGYINNAKAYLSKLIKRVRERERQGGQLKGRIRIAKDFDEFDDEMDRLYYGDSESFGTSHDR
jgi:hypothetical protein